MLLNITYIKLDFTDYNECVEIFLSSTFFNNIQMKPFPRWLLKFHVKTWRWMKQVLWFFFNKMVISPWISFTNIEWIDSCLHWLIFLSNFHKILLFVASSELPVLYNLFSDPLLIVEICFRCMNWLCRFFFIMIFYTRKIWTSYRKRKVCAHMKLI